jgi:gustatory receptor
MWLNNKLSSDDIIIDSDFHFEDKYFDGSFHEASKLGELVVSLKLFKFVKCKIAVWRIGKFFGLFPINIKSRNPREIIFKWFSLRTFISIIFIFCCFFCVYFEASRLFFIAKDPEISMSSIAGVIFYLSVFAGYNFLFNISLKFSPLFTLWMKCEIQLSTAFQPDSSKWTLKKKISLLVSAYLTLALVEHTMAVSNEIYGIVKDVTYCETKDIDLIATFVSRRMGFFIDRLPFEYNNFFGIFIEYFNIAATFTWNYFDLTIIVISMGMSSMFEKLNYRIESLRYLLVSEMTWSEVREDYVKVCELLREVNKIMGVFVIFSSSTDGYFIVLQLLNIMK